MPRFLVLSVLLLSLSSSARAGATAGDVVHVAAGSAIDGLQLRRGQALVGDGTGASVRGTVVLAGDNRIENVTIAAPAGSPALMATGPVGTVALRGVRVTLTGGDGLVASSMAGEIRWSGGAISGTGTAVRVNGGSGTIAFDGVPIDVTDSLAVDVRNTAVDVSLGSVSAVAQMKRVPSAIVVQDSTAPFAVHGGRIERMNARAVMIANATHVALHDLVLHENATNGVSGPNCGGDLIRGDNSGCNAAIYLRDVRGASIDGVRVEGTAQAGINGLRVSDLVISKTTILNAGNEPGEHAMNFRDLLGHSTFSQVTVRAAAERALNVENGSGEATIDIAESTLGEPVERTANHGVLAGVHDNAKMTLSMRGCTLQRNGSAAFQATAAGRSAMTVTVENNTFTANGSAVTLVAGDAATMTYAITRNTISTNRSAPISVSMSKPSSGRVSGSITANVIGRAGVIGSGAHCGSCNGIVIWSIGDGRLAADIGGNTIREVDGPAIRVGAGDGSPEVDVAIHSNIIEEPAVETAPSAIRVQSGTAATDHSVVCAAIGGSGAAANQIRGAWANGVEVVNRFPGTTLRLAGFRGDGKDLNAVAAHLTKANGGTTAKAALTKAPEGNSFTGGDACTITP